MKFLSLILTVLIFAFSVSCNKDIKVVNPANEVMQADVFASEGNCTAAILGLYGRMMSTNLTLSNGGLSVYCGLSADDIVNTTSSFNYDPFASNSLPASNEIVNSSFWNASYSAIYHANSIIEGLEKSALSKSFANSISSEARFVRAWYYLQLVSLFGNVPLVVSTDYSLNAVLPKTDSSTIYRQIIADLKFATAYGHPGYAAGKRIRADRNAAKALLARVYLYARDWDKAAQLSGELLTASGYQLVSPSACFLASSAESIFQLQPTGSRNTAEGNLFIPSSATVRPGFMIYPSLYSLFAANDLRKSNWISSSTVSGTVYNYPAKYKVRTGGAPYQEHNILLRWAEQWLINAEAKAQSDDLEGAATSLNKVRQRAGLPATTATGKEGLLAAIQLERRLEFFAEAGHRWFDLKRTGTADVFLASLKPDWDEYKLLYPIPFTETQRNPFLGQNKGY